MNTAVAYPAASAPLSVPALESARVVADVGGTFARLAWAQPGDDAPTLQDMQTFRCAEHASLGAILAAFLAGRGPGPVDAVVAIAGVLQGDCLVNANLPWAVSCSATRAEAGLQSLQIINDFEAVALAVPHIRDDALAPLRGAPPHAFAWPALVLGAGTGLGAALRLESGDVPVLPSEVGHSALAAGTPLELDVLRLLLEDGTHVANEHVLSGTGLRALYRAMARLRAQPGTCTTTEAIVAAANRGDDALAMETVQVFCGWLGSFAGDLAITFGARSVYLAGGICGHIPRFLHDGTFAARFVDKGTMGPLLENVPVWRVDHGALGMVGAAAWRAPRR